MIGAAQALPRVTIMLPVRNEAQHIETTLRQLYEQSYPRDRFEVIVADGMSDDATAEIVRQFAGTHPDFALRLVSNRKRVSSAGRNLAVAHGTGSYYLLVDGHVFIPTRNLVADMVSAALVHGAQVLGRPQPLSPPDIGEFQRFVALARQSPLAHSGESFIYSEFEGWTSPISIGVMYRRDVFDVVGKFDESFDAAEDLEFNYRVERAGIRCFTSSRFAVYYYPRASFRELCRQMRRYGYGRAAFVFKHPERFRPETIVPAGFVVTVAGLLGVGAFWRPGWTALAALLLIYASILTAEGFRLARIRGASFSWRLPAIIACVHVGLGVGFLNGSGRKLRECLRRPS
jgi:succinoglycan biosynthesis protein ExoA